MNTAWWEATDPTSVALPPVLAASELIAYSALPRTLFVRLDLRHLVRGDKEVLCGTSLSRAADRQWAESPPSPQGL